MSNREKNNCYSKIMCFGKIDITLSNVNYHRFTRISARDFNNLFTYVSKIRSTYIKSAPTCLALFLTKLRTAMSHSILSILFGIQRHNW